MEKVKFERLLLIAEREVSNNKEVLQIVRWGKGKPTLEKRGYFLKDDEWFTAKAKGFNAEDFKMIMENKERIEDTLEHG